MKKKILFFSFFVLHCGLPNIFSQPLLSAYLSPHLITNNLLLLPDEINEVFDTNAINLKEKWLNKVDEEKMYGIAVYFCGTRDELEIYPFDKDFSSLIQPIGVSYFYYTLNSKNQVSEALVDFNNYFAMVRPQKIIEEGQFVVDEVSKYLSLIKEMGWDLKEVIIVTVRLHLYHIMIYNGVSYVIKNNKLEHLNNLLKRDKEYFDLFFANMCCY